MLTWTRDAQSRAHMVPLGCFCSHGLAGGCGSGAETPEGICRRSRGANCMEWFETGLQAEAALRTWRWVLATDQHGCAPQEPLLHPAPVAKELAHGQVLSSFWLWLLLAL